MEREKEEGVKEKKIKTKEIKTNKTTMKWIISFFIFFVVLLFYLHIHYHLRVSDDLEMFEMDPEQFSKEKLNEVCDIKQPLVFPVITNSLWEPIQKVSLYNNLEQYGAFDITLKSSSFLNSNTESISNEHSIRSIISCPLNKAITMFPNYYSENNQHFLKETNLLKTFQHKDSVLRPPILCQSSYDVWLGGQETTTPFRYEVYYRTFLSVSVGDITIKLAPPKNKRYLHTQYDYMNYEFYSPINPWNPQVEFQKEFQKVKCLEFRLKAGQVFFLPPYWWYSIRMNSHINSIAVFHYQTYMSLLSVFPYIGLHWLQIQNVRVHYPSAIHSSETNEDNSSSSDNIKTSESSLFPSLSKRLKKEKIITPSSLEETQEGANNSDYQTQTNDQIDETIEQTIEDTINVGNVLSD
jgi:hypothetical protein